jgi:hypothetical protein
MSERLHPLSIEGAMPIPDPRTIVTQTAVLLPMYFSDALEDESAAVNYFSGYTSLFLKNANRGFMLTRGINLTDATEQDLSKLLLRSEDLATDDPDIASPKTRAIESFNLTVTIFSQMPELADYHKYSPVGANKMAVIPPRNSFEYMERIEELRKFIDGITANSVKQKHVRRFTLQDSVYRAMAFFQVGKDLPTRITPKKDEVIQMLRESFH